MKLLGGATCSGTSVTWYGYDKGQNHARQSLEPYYEDHAQRIADRYLMMTGTMSAEVKPPVVSGVEVATSSLPAADKARVDTITQNVSAVEAKGLTVGENAVVYTQRTVTLSRTMPTPGAYMLVSSVRTGTLPTSTFARPQFSFCHAAAMAAVYTIGAAVIAAAALTGGLTIAGVFLAPAALNALSIALAAGAGVSALVAVYIC